MADRVKVYEEGTKKSLPLWAWLLPLLLLLALLAFFFLHPQTGAAGPTSEAAPAATSVPVQNASTLPKLGTVHFETGKATLTPEGTATLQQAAAAMKNNPSAHLRLEGYTDSTGSTGENATLSQQRAVTVAEYLKRQGIDGSRLTGAGFGQSNPADTNSTDQGKADNRRVELFSQQ